MFAAYLLPVSHGSTLCSKPSHTTLSAFWWHKGFCHFDIPSHRVNAQVISKSSAKTALHHFTDRESSKRKSVYLVPDFYTVKEMKKCVLTGLRYTSDPAVENNLFSDRTASQIGQDLGLCSFFCFFYSLSFITSHL